VAQPIAIAERRTTLTSRTLAQLNLNFRGGYPSTLSFAIFERLCSVALLCADLAEEMARTSDGFKTGVMDIFDDLRSTPSSGARVCTQLEI
jgi:hypothetical protein